MRCALMCDETIDLQTEGVRAMRCALMCDKTIYKQKVLVLCVDV
jgi:hypothetical protein